MKKSMQVLLLIYIGIINSTSAQNSAPSCHMAANDNATGDILMKTVRSTITTDATYYCTMQWNAGSEGGAYCGFQDSPDKGHTFIYSIWDPSNGQTITSAFTGAGTVVENFGGEGTGLKSMNNTIGWSLNEWNTVVTRRWAVGSHTHFGYWIRRGSEDKWYHMVTMDYPVSGVYFNGTTNAFLEDWLSTGSNKRRFEMRDGFKRKTDGTWIPMTQATFNRNDESRSSNYTNSNDAGTITGGYYMQSGGNSTPSYAGNPPITLNSNPPSSPSNSAIIFSISSATTNSVSWTVPTSSTPQFKYTIKVNGSQVASAIAPEVRSQSITASAGNTIEVMLEDILGRTTTHIATIDSNDPIISQSGWTLHYVNSEETSGENGAATNAFDGNTSSIWHTQWSGSSPSHPHEIQINLGASYTISGLIYKPRNSGSNGTIAGYQIYVSTDGSNWGTAVKTGTWSGTNEKTVTFSSKTGNYIRLVATSEINNNAWASAAEINLMGTAIESVPTVIYTDSNQSGHEGPKAVDDNNSTMWHTKWSGGNDPYPHEIHLDLGANVSVSGLTYLPRQDGGQNGTIAGYEIYVSTNTSSWGSAVKTGTWANNTSQKTATFSAKTGRYVRLRALSEINGNAWASAAELSVSTSVGARTATSEDTITEYLVTEPNFMIYPNPTKSIVHLSIHSHAKEKVNIQILDVGGKIYSSKSHHLDIGANKLSLDIQSIKKGLYTVRVKGSSINHIGKVIISE